MRSWIRLAIVLVVISLGIIAASVVYRLTFYAFEPLTIIETTIENPTVKYGDNIVVKHVYMRYRYCKVDIDRFIVSLPDQTLVRRERLPAGTVLIGRSERKIFIPTKFPSQIVIPFGIADIAVQDLFPGRCYLLREFVHSECDRTHSVLAPDARFCVE